MASSGEQTVGARRPGRRRKEDRRVQWETGMDRTRVDAMGEGEKGF